jgi:hypothetical protein
LKNFRLRRSYARFARFWRLLAIFFLVVGYRLSNILATLVGDSSDARLGNFSLVLGIFEFHLFQIQNDKDPSYQ